MASKQVLGALVALAFSPLDALPAQAAPGAGGRATTNTTPLGFSLEEIAVMLSTSSPDELRIAIEACGTLGTKDALPLLEERIRSGLPSDLLTSAIDVIVQLRDPSSGPLL